jgi:hypothetical protein
VIVKKTKIDDPLEIDLHKITHGGVRVSDLNIQCSICEQTRASRGACRMFQFSAAPAPRLRSRLRFPRPVAFRWKKSSSGARTGSPLKDTSISTRFDEASKAQRVMAEGGVRLAVCRRESETASVDGETLVAAPVLVACQCFLRDRRVRPFGAPQSSSCDSAKAASCQR